MIGPALWRLKPGGGVIEDKWQTRVKGDGGRTARVNLAAELCKRPCPRCGRMIIYRNGAFAFHHRNYETQGDFSKFEACL